MTIALYTLVYLSIIFGLRDLAPVGSRLRTLLSKNREADFLRQGVLVLRSVQDRLESGGVPEAEDWERVRGVVAPWGSVFYQTLMESRDRGAPVLPSLVRMQRLLEEQARWVVDAGVKLAPAMGQAMLALLLVPMFAAALWFLLPGLEGSAFEFFSVVVVALLMGLAAFYWMTEMGENARYGSLLVSRRTWIASSVIALERLNALVMVGEPPDLAWNEVLAELVVREPELAARWGSLVWTEGAGVGARGAGAGACGAGAGGERAIVSSSTEAILIALGHEVKRLIQTSLIEGQGALERVEAVQRAFMTDLRGRIERELAGLGNRSLKPLFFLVMPAIVLLLGVAMALTMRQWV